VGELGTFITVHIIDVRNTVYKNVHYGCSLSVQIWVILKNSRSRHF